MGLFLIEICCFGNLVFTVLLCVLSWFWGSDWLLVWMHGGFCILNFERFLVWSEFLGLFDWLG